MKDTSALNLFPKMRVKPFDGMSVTAEVWAQAHEEHRQALNAHNLISHGSGIITGLEVVANDPPDQLVFISPGVAVDTEGNVIVVPEPLAYDFGGTVEGELFLFLGQGEREIGGVGDETRFVQSEFVVAARASLPKRPVVELARVNLSKVGKAIKDADIPRHPGLDMLDLRFRSQIHALVHQSVRVLVAELGTDEPGILSGWDHLGNFCSQATQYHLIVDKAASFPADLDGFDLVYISGMGKFAPNEAMLKALNEYIKQGKTLFVEALNDAGQEACQGLLDKLKLKVKPLDKKDALLSEPFLFTSSPSGFSGNQVKVGKQVIYSTAGYALAWAGQTTSGASSRTDIRSAHEWGVNLISHCLTKVGD